MKEHYQIDWWKSISGEDFPRFLECLPDAVMVTDSEGRILLVNRAFERLFGWTRGEIEGKHWEQIGLVLPENLKETKDTYRMVWRGEEKTPYQTFCLNRDGIPVEVSVSYSRIPDGRPAALLALYRGVSPPSRNPNEKPQSLPSAEGEESWDFPPDGDTEAVAILDLDGRVVQGTPAFANLYANEEKAFVGRKLHDILSIRREDADQSLQHALSGTNVCFTAERTGENGRLFPVSVTLSPLRDAEGSTANVAAVIRRAAEPKKTEEALQESEWRYRLIAENTSDLIKVLDEGGTVQYASPSHQRILGFSPGEYVGRPFTHLVHPEDISLVKEQFDKAFSGKGTCLTEFRYRHQGGFWIWVEAKGTPVMDKHGRVRHIVVVTRDIMQRKQYEEYLRQMAYHDMLTGLPNRKMLDDQLIHMLERAKSAGRLLAVLYLDCDEFKKINDTKGHDIGDQLLKGIASRLSKCVRETDLVARIGGDEFVIVLPDLQQEEEAVEVAEKVVRAMRRPWRIGDHLFPATASVGISIYPRDGTEKEELMKRADLAMYEVKNRGKNGFQRYRG